MFTGRILATGALAARLLDILENIGMLLSLNGHLSDGNSLLTCIFAVSKWGLVLAAIGYINSRCLVINTKIKKSLIMQVLIISSLFIKIVTIVGINRLSLCSRGND